MSAFIVQPKHIDFLLSYAAQYGITVYDVEHGRVVREYSARVDVDLTALGRVLTAVNVASVNFRYRENTPVPAYNFRTYRPASAFAPVQVLKACACFDYQSCELPEYGDTFAAKIVERIRKHAIGQLPGYETAAWEIAS